MRKIHCEIFGSKIPEDECKGHREKKLVDECEDCPGWISHVKEQQAPLPEKESSKSNEPKSNPTQKEQPAIAALRKLPPVPDSLRKHCPPLLERCPICRNYGTDDAMYIINWGADFKSIDTNDVRDVAYAMCLSWWDRTVYNSVYNGMLAIDRNEESMLYRCKAEFLKRYCNLGPQALLDITKPLAISAIHTLDSDHIKLVEFFVSFAGEINEYGALQMCWQGYEHRLEKEPPLEDKLRNRLLREVSGLIKKSFGSIAQQRNYSELAAFILAKRGIIDTKCAYKEKHCNRTDCVKQRFKELPQHGNIKPVECFKIFSRLKISDSLETAKPVKERLEQCNDCTYREKACPAYFPCPTGKQAFKKELQRKKYKGCSVEEFLEDCWKYYDSGKCREFKKCKTRCYLEELSNWQDEMDEYVTNEQIDQILD